MSLVPFILLAHIDQDEILFSGNVLLLLLKPVMYLFGGPFRNLFACPAQNLTGCFTHL